MISERNSSHYHVLGMSGLFIRPLTPLGFACDRWNAIGYTSEEYVSFYCEAFDEIIDNLTPPSYAGEIGESRDGSAKIKTSCATMSEVSQAKLEHRRSSKVDKSSLAHSCWECQYHIVFIPKYRKKVMYGKVRDDVREIIRTLCKYKKVEIVAGAVCADHVHL